MGQGGGHGYGRGKGGRGEGSTAEFLMKLIMLFNLFFIIMGAAMVSFGFWITLDTEFKRWVKDLGMEHFWVGVYILMAAGGLLMVQSFFGICGAYQRKSTLLLIFQGCLVVCFVLEIVGAAYMLANGIRYSRIEYWLTDRFYNLIDVYNYDQASARIMNIVQEWVGCCGAKGSADYVRWNKVIPNTCYDPITGNAWYIKDYGYVGCVRGFTMFLETKAGWISGLALFIAFFQIFCIGFTCYFIQGKRAYQEYRKSQEFLDRR